MKKRQFFFIITLLLCISAKSYAQWEVPFSHYWEVKGYYNPSFAGETDKIRSSALYHFQNAGINDAPQRLVITADLPFEFNQRIHGAGIIAYTESIGTLHNSLIAAQYSFKQQIGNGMLSIGFQGGIYDLNYDKGSFRLITDTPQNNTPLSNSPKNDTPQNSQSSSNVNITNKQVADLNAGISWTGDRFFAGLSAMHFNHPGFQTTPDSNSKQKTEINSGQQGINNLSSTDSTRTYIPITYNFIAGYNIGLFNSLEIQPMIGLLHDENRTEAQGTVRLEYAKRFSGGFSLTSNNGKSFFAGATLQGFRFGYAYTTYNKGAGEVSRSNHELFLRYDFTLNSFKPKLQPHKSIRLL